MNKCKFLKTPLILMLALFFVIPLTLVGCGKGDGKVETPNSQDSQYIRYTECVKILKTALNNIRTNKNDILDGFGIYWTTEFDGRVNENYFESQKGEDHYDLLNYYATYKLKDGDSSEMLRHVTKYTPENNYNGTYTYVKKDEYETCTNANHTLYNTKSLTEMVDYFLHTKSSYELSNDVVIGWYESFEDKNDFKIVCKYDEDIVEYTVENGKIVALDIKSGPSSNLAHTLVKIKYGIEVDAYNEFLVAIGVR